MDIRTLQRAIVDGLEDVKAQDIVVFDTEKLSSLFERVIVASGTSNRQTKALASSVRERVKSQGGRVLSVEGADNGEWIIVDCGAAVVHIMQPAIRTYYHLEEIWGETPVRVKLGAIKQGLVKAAEPDAPAAKPKTPRKKAAPAEAPVSAAAKKPAAKKSAPSKTAAAKTVGGRTAAAKPAAKKVASKAPVAPVRRSDTPARSRSLAEVVASKQKDKGARTLAAGKVAAKSPARNAAGKTAARAPVKVSVKSLGLAPAKVASKTARKTAASKAAGKTAARPAAKKAPARKAPARKAPARKA